MSGKGDDPRPKDIDDETFSSNWDRIFGKKEDPVIEESDNDEDNEPWHVRNARHLMKQNAEWEAEQARKKKERDKDLYD